VHRVALVGRKQRQNQRAKAAAPTERHKGLIGGSRLLQQNLPTTVIVLQRKSRPKAALNSNLLIVDQAAINARFDFRRYAIAPMPAKPRIIIAQVEGSGTAASRLTLSTPNS
jgi:hypothetical protein